MLGFYMQSVVSLLACFSPKIEDSRVVSVAWARAVPQEERAAAAVGFSSDASLVCTVSAWVGYTPTFLARQIFEMKLPNSIAQNEFGELRM